MRTRQRIRRITGAGAPETSTNSHVSSGTQSTIVVNLGDGGARTPMHMCNAASLPTDITRYFSYGMVAVFPSTTACAADINDCDWIGPASEIEGGAPPSPGITGGGSFSISDALHPDTGTCEKSDE